MCKDFARSSRVDSPPNIHFINWGGPKRRARKDKVILLEREGEQLGRLGGGPKYWGGAGRNLGGRDRKGEIFQSPRGVNLLKGSKTITKIIILNLDKQKK